METYEFEGRTTEEAIEAASRKLNLPVEELNIDVIEPGSAGIFGLVGGKNAKIKVTLKDRGKDDGEDGLIIKDEFGAGLLLPQVAIEWGWDAKEFLDNTCRKAGLDVDCWNNMRRNVYKFQAQIFSEEKGKVIEKKLKA